jgi:HTH-type transcriptional regulator, global nitrogen regulator NrpRI
LQRGRYGGFAGMLEKTTKKKNAILSILKDMEKPMRSSRIAQELLSQGYDISERTVRLYLQDMCDDGLIEKADKRCHRITERGLFEFEATNTIERVGFLSAKIDQMTYRMNFNLNTRTGCVVVNTTLADPHQVVKCLPLMQKVYADGYAMGNLTTFLAPGERIGQQTVPDGMIGIGTVCSITLNGVLLQHGIPTNSRFGGVLELRDKKPVRFVEIIMYDGTSIDPLEVFIRSGMTNYIGAIKTGNGRIGAGFREFPAESRDMVEGLAEKLEKAGLGAFMCIGRPGQPLLEIPVSEGRVGAIVIGGLNPVSILEESGFRVHSRALSGLLDFSRLFHYEEMEERLKQFLS